MMEASGPFARFMRSTAEFLMGRVMLSLFVLALLLVMVWAFRYPLLRVTGRFLIKEDPGARGDVLVVLGGAPVERGIAAARLFKEGAARNAVFTGSVVPQSVQAAGLFRSEAWLTRSIALKAGLPASEARLLEIGTSTWEECAAVRDLALSSDYDTVVVVTTEFHTRRVRRVFNKVLGPSGIAVFVRAAPSIKYDPLHWWRTEEGLLMVNNEYVKLLYYAIKY